MKKRKARIEEFERSKETIELYGGEVEMFDVRPAHAKTEVPVVICPGWGGTPTMYRDNILTLAELGRRTLAIRAPHGVETDRPELKDVPNAEARKIAALTEMLEKKGIDSADIIAHSEGCLYSVLAATIYPEKFRGRTLVLVNPSGMIGKDTPLRLSTSFALDAVRGFLKAIRDRKLLEPTLRAGNEITKSALENPIQAVKEIFAISDADIPEMVAALTEQGIHVVIIHAVDDLVFPMNKVQQYTKAKAIEGFYSVAGNHGRFMADGPRYTKLAENAITKVEEKYASKVSKA